MAKVITDNQHYADIAEAIRTKNETETLYKPSEMAPAILAIQGGVELNFDVVGNPKPSNPDPNTIWIDTDTEITGWVFSDEKPTNPIPGMVWVRTDSSGVFSFNAVKENELNVRIVYAMQFTSAGWDSKTAAVYQDGKWKSFSWYLYNRGDLCEDITGGWINPNIPPNTNRANPVFNSDHIKMYATNDIATIASTVNIIDTRLYDRAEVVVNVVDTYSGYAALKVNLYDKTGNQIASADTGANFKGNKTISISLGGIDGAYFSLYVGGLSQYKALVYEVILIPRGEDA